ncbi:MAG: winged helix-turn-helix domain-containing protein [Byssovorax sp.]
MAKKLAHLAQAWCSSDMARSKKGEAIRAERRTPSEVRQLEELQAAATKASDLATWRRATAVLGYLAGKAVLSMTGELHVSRSAINDWLRWYDSAGADGLRTGKAPGAPCRLTVEQLWELTGVIEEGPQAAGFTTGVWTGPMVRDWIASHFQVSYHVQHLPRLLHDLGFSVQRPRKRLARADAEAQAVWLNERMPAIKKKPRAAGAWLSSRMKPASGSTEPFTRLGPP